MKKFTSLFVFSAIIVGCTAAEVKTATNTAIDVATTLCIVAHAEDADQDILTACNLTQDLLPVVQQLVSQTRTSSRRFAASHPNYSGPLDGGK